MGLRTHGSWCRSSATAARIGWPDHQSSLRVGRAHGSPLLLKGHELCTCFHTCHHCPKDLKKPACCVASCLQQFKEWKRFWKVTRSHNKVTGDKTKIAESHWEKAPEGEKGDKQGDANLAAAKDISVDNMFSLYSRLCQEFCWTLWHHQSSNAFYGLVTRWIRDISPIDSGNIPTIHRTLLKAFPQHQLDFFLSNLLFVG